jgi:hypothetical protein
MLYQHGYDSQRLESFFFLLLFPFRSIGLIFLSFLIILQTVGLLGGARGSVVGSGAMLQAGPRHSSGG